MVIKNQKLTGLALTIYNLEVWMGLHYDPDNPKYYDAPKPDKPEPKEVRTPTKTTDIIADNVHYVPKTGKWMREIVSNVTDKEADNTLTTGAKVTDKKNNETDRAVTAEWEVLTTPKNTADVNTERQPLLTSDDLKLIREKGFDEAKAQTIKDFWYREISRREATKLLAKTSKGYSDSVVKDYYTIFNKPFKEAEPPTPKKK